MNPRTECGCQSVAFMISGMVAPPFRRGRSRTTAFLENSRGTAAVAAFLVLVFAVAGLAAFAAFLALGAPFLAVAFLVALVAFGATGAPASAAAAAWVAVVVSVAFMVVNPSWRQLGRIHMSALRAQGVKRAN